DLLMVTVHLFEAFPDVLASYQERFRYVLVDEYQDTNHAQYRLVNQLASQHRNVCVVGDADQSVYAFRGADLRNILEFERDYPDARVVVLDRNYRSTEAILEAANSVIVHNVGRQVKHLWTDRGAGEPPMRYEAEDEHDEAAFVAEQVGRLEQAGYRPADVAVFYRTNAQSRVLEEVFVRYGIPYRVVGAVKFYDRKEVKDALAYLRVLVNPDDHVALKRILNVPKRGIGDTSVGHLERFAQAEGVSLHSALHKADDVVQLSPRAQRQMKEFLALLDLLREVADSGPRAAVEAVLAETGYLAELEAERSIEAQGRADNLKELLSVAEEFEKREAEWGDGEVVEEASGLRRLELFLESISLVADVDELGDSLEAVTLMTLHNAKGLEYPVVFMAGMEEGVFPHQRSLTEPQELEEERRLCYVGITRAQDRLYLTNAFSRRLWGGLNYNSPSRFLSELPAGLSTAAKRERNPRMESRSPGPSLNFARVGAGDRVRHDKWGLGTVQEVVGVDERAEVVVDFDEAGPKRLALVWAPLHKV
ncbi:MAG: UvrD-helicase domain-containing protein, partial [Actinomycetota bacterium]|nr:UvrD-helicase domain-containing protein [Actinomycetota bacterium]